MTIRVRLNLCDKEVLMNMSSVAFDGSVGTFLVARIIGGKNDVPTVELDIWNVFRPNGDIVRPTVQVPSFAVAPILTEVRDVAKFRVAMVFFRLHVNGLL